MKRDRKELMVTEAVYGEQSNQTPYGRHAKPESVDAAPLATVPPGLVKTSVYEIRSPGWLFGRQRWGLMRSG